MKLISKITKNFKISNNQQINTAQIMCLSVSKQSCTVAEIRKGKLQKPVEMQLNGNFERIKDTGIYDLMPGIGYIPHGIALINK